MSDEQLQKLVKALRERERPDPLAVAPMRARMEEIGQKFPAPDSAVVEAVTIAGRPAEWVSASGCDSARQVLYLHGGGYVQGSPDVYRCLAYRLAEESGARVLVLDYRLAPEHPFPAAVDDALAAYHALLDQGADPRRLAIAGDSAGGGLTVATLVALREAGARLPAGAVCISPWTDLAGTGESVAAKRDEDPMVDIDVLHWFAGLYLAGTAAETPLASPLHADLAGLPPMLIQVGTAEILLDDATRLAKRAQAAGVDVTLRVWERMVHVWPLFSPILEEGRQALAESGAWLRERTK